MVSRQQLMTCGHPARPERRVSTDRPRSDLKTADTNRYALNGQNREIPA
jgi:hypothetical protein